MTQSSVVKTVGGVTTKITTMTRTSYSQQQILQQQQQQQLQTNQKVITKPPYTQKEKHTSTSNFQKNERYNEPTSIMKPQRTDPPEDICVRCNKTVYKMVAVIAEHQVWHRSCFRCSKCDKQLNRHSKVDNFQIHEGVLYCQYHFKQRFGQTNDGAVHVSEQYQLIRQDIQSNAVKTSLNKNATTTKTTEELQHNVNTKRGATVLSKMEKFHTKGMDVGVSDLKANEKERKNDFDDESIHSEDYGEDADVDLIRAKRLLSKLPIKVDDMNEIKDKFEAGIDDDREARRLERKQEIQDIRSRVYLGKQARTKEKYENAVAKLEIIPKLRNKGLLMAYELGNVKAAAEKTRNAKQRFETGDIYRREPSFDRERSVTSPFCNKVSERMQMLAKRQAQDEITKSKVKVMEKPDISNQCKFFENCNPEKQKGYAIKIDGINIGALKMDGTVEKARNAYIGRIKKNKIIKQQQWNE
ncbi:uncharacterized protein LOC119081278 isoform X1 [Bradysia coprophila]|uniref:uncharacterized protein LOC119081278 isoform X1 n=2 Tax=Bradysia coprophila TaxID=38358 RepID=UPI00187DCF5B|nr:uncharacterized protein LOC119081278 isoform X1 [Bradysia coprophila]XP_037045930.1 uncharacterized protein LOC119081278 isoform X1 [Bradysia coprophila]XP_037045931.1 uncharacterized protein LOC119081278 isoform X1 [Bradysia coprophila]